MLVVRTVLLLLVVARWAAFVAVLLWLTRDLGLQMRRLDLTMVGHASRDLLLLTISCRLRL